MKIKVKITTNENMKYFNCEKNTIQEVEFEDYITCVVAGEMGNAPEEALKAQAIASRSYACAQGVLDGKVISDNSSKAQAYRAPRIVYKNCTAAAKATVGQVLKYGGKYAATYFCHSNGGRTYSSEEVWGGVRNYLVARKDPWTTEPKNGHGVGMSQVGAIAAAKQGVGFKEILSFYYPKTTLTKIEMKQEDDDDGDYYDKKIIEEIKVRVELALRDIGEMI